MNQYDMAASDRPMATSLQGLLILLSHRLLEGRSMRTS